MDKLDPLYKNHVTVTGNPDAKQAMVFVHGFGTDQTVWAPVAAAFADDFKLVLFDNVGAGQSAPEAFIQHRYLKLGLYADDLLAICNALQLENVILVGHSVGGMISLLATIKAPERISRLIMIGSSPRYRNDGPYLGGVSDSDLAQLYSTIAQRYAEWADHFAALAMANADRPHLAEYFAVTLKSIPANQALTVLCSIFQCDHRQELALVTTPTLLIQSRDDVAVPLAVAEYLRQQIRGSHLAVIDAEGHFPHVSAPEQVITAIRGFLATSTNP